MKWRSSTILYSPVFKPVIFILILILILPLIIYLAGKKQDIRPRALGGLINFSLSPSVSGFKVNDKFEVLISGSVPNNRIRVSGIDVTVLYEKNRLEVLDMSPAVSASDANIPFTDLVTLTSGGYFDDKFNYLRVSEVARKNTQNLPSGTFPIAKVTFLAKSKGEAAVKFPDGNKYLQAVGIETTE